MKIASYEKKLIESANAACLIQREDGSYPPGHNNKWEDLDTPVRATSHFIIQLLFAFKTTNDQKFLDAARKAGDFLFSDFARPGQKTFFCRISSIKDMCNGLIGQAWGIEALLQLGKMTQKEKYFNLAFNIFSLHPYSRKYGLFHPVECDGTVKKIAKTLNHQLIFAAMGMGLIGTGYTKIKDDVEDFYAQLNYNVYQDQSGLIHHHVSLGSNPIDRTVFNSLRYFQRKMILERSIGYFSFNLFGLALAKVHNPDSIVWKEKSIIQIIDKANQFASSEDYMKRVKANDFALAFRLTGQEILIFQKAFGYKFNENAFDLIEFQFKNHWDSDKKLLCRNTGDPNTLSSRLYEMTYLIS